MQKVLVSSNSRRTRVKAIMKALPICRSGFMVAVFFLLTMNLALTGCGGGGDGAGAGVSSQVVSGVAAAGAPLSGQVSIRDSSTPTQQRTTAIGTDGSYALDVTNMKGPFILEGTGSANGVNYKLHSFAEGPGTAHINPLSDVAVADAAGDDDPGHVYKNHDSAILDKVKSHITDSVAELLAKLKPLLAKFNADNDDPIKGHYKTDHSRLDGVFDHVTITLVDGILTITNTKTGAIIFTGKVTDIKGGHFTDNDDDLPTPGSAPAPPTQLTAVGGDGQVNLSWTAVTGATSYNVYWSTTSPVTTSGTPLSSATNTLSHTGLTAGTTYIYIVTAVNSAGESVASPEASATTSSTPPTATVPAAPTNVQAVGGTKQVTINWPDVTDATSYNLYWSTTTGVTPATATAAGKNIIGVIRPAVHSALADSTTYYYVVTAVNSLGESAPSGQVQATTLNPVAPAAPRALAVGGAKQVTITWPDVTGATSYNLYWSTTTGVTPATATAAGKKVTGATSPAIQSGLADGTTYYYVVTAMNGSAESLASGQVSATTAPATPANVQASGGAKQVSLTWDPVTGATSYNVYSSTISGSGATGTPISRLTNSYVQTGLLDSTPYYYVVTAVNAAGESAASSQASATTNAPAVPAAPTNVQASGGAKQVSLTWNPVTGATSYNVYSSTISGSGATGTPISRLTNSYVQTGLLDSTTYYYVVTAVSAAGESAASSQASATTTAPAPPPPALCFSCHGTPPPTGRHASHFPSRVDTCATCHGAGYDPYGAASALPATHANTVINIASGDPPGLECNK